MLIKDKKDPDANILRAVWLYRPLPWKNIVMDPTIEFMYNENAR